MAQGAKALFNEALGGGFRVAAGGLRQILRITEDAAFGPEDVGPTVALAIPAYFAIDNAVSRPEPHAKTNKQNWDAIVDAGSRVAVVVLDSSFGQFEIGRNDAAIQLAKSYWRALHVNGVQVLGYVNVEGGARPWVADVATEVEQWWNLYGELLSGMYLDVGPYTDVDLEGHERVTWEHERRANYEAYYAGIRSFTTRQPPGDNSSPEIPWRVFANTAGAGFRWLPDVSDWQLVWEAPWQGYQDDTNFVVNEFGHPLPSPAYWWAEGKTRSLRAHRIIWALTHWYHNLRGDFRRAYVRAGWAEFRRVSHTVVDCDQNHVPDAVRKANGRGAGMIWVTDSTTVTGNTTYTFPLPDYWQALLAQLPPPDTTPVFRPWP